MGVNFSPDGMRMVSAYDDNIARIWDGQTTEGQPADTMETNTECHGGAQLNPKLGGLRVSGESHQFGLRKFLEEGGIGENLGPIAPMPRGPDWRFIFDRMHHADPKDCPVSPRMTVTIQQVSMSLIGTMNPVCIREALSLDPGHPLLPFASARMEADETLLLAESNHRDGNLVLSGMRPTSMEAGETHADRLPVPPNRVRIAWLINYGLKRLPSDTGASDLRVAAKLIARAAENMPEQKTRTESPRSRPRQGIGGRRDKGTAAGRWASTATGTPPSRSSLVR